MTPTPTIHAFFDPATWTVSYVVYETDGSPCAIIDPVLDYDPKSGRTSTTSADRIVDFIQAHQLSVAWILETHAHADHVSAAAYLKQQLGGIIAIGEHIRTVQTVFKGVFNLEADFRTDGGQFDHLFTADEPFQIGRLAAKALLVPGHTPADVAYQVGDNVFVGDTLFMPDVGTARCDFPGGNAPQLYQSIQRILSLPDDTTLWLCHDYPPTERDVCWQSSVAAQRAANLHVHDGISQAEFVAMRAERDAGLAMPVLILPAVQLNIRAGELPPAEANGTRYLKIPLNAL